MKGELTEILTEMKLKKTHSYCDEFNFNFSLIKSEPKLYNMQQFHCGEFIPCEYGDSAKIF